MRRVRLDDYANASSGGGLYGLAQRILTTYDGDLPTKKCRCPHHGGDGLTLAVDVQNGKLLVHCFHPGCDQSSVIAALRRDGLWPGSGDLEGAQSSEAANAVRKPDERRQYALNIYNQLLATNRGGLADVLEAYLAPRRLKVPDTALLALPLRCAPVGTEPSEVLRTDNPGMVLPLRDKTGKFAGIQSVWLDWTLTKKRDEEPRRQTYGLLRGNFVELVELDYQNPPPKLIIGEGVETVLSAIVLTGLPGIATAGNVANVEPPSCAEYILLVDCDDSGGSRQGAGTLAQRLVGSVVRIATPVRPEGGKSGYDYNDALIDAGDDAAKRAELTRSLLESPRFEDVMTAAERREVRLNALAALRLDDTLGYEEQRKTAAKDLNIRVGALDQEVVSRGEALKAAKAKVPPKPIDVELLAASARHIIASNDVLELFAHEVSKVIAGETTIVKVLYLVGTSRLFDKTMHAAVKGPSAAGKSQLRGSVVNYFPPESVYSFTAQSEKALLYVQEDFQHKILSMGEAIDTESQKFQNYMLRELMSEGKLRYSVPQKVGSAIETITIEKNGPVAFLITTTRNALDPENETRLLSLEVDDGERQTRAVIQKVAQTIGRNNSLAILALKPWHDFQRWLAAGERRVVVPFAETLGQKIHSAKSVRLRRDFGQLIVAIKAHALLHRDHRARDADGAIIATIVDDYRIVRTLMTDILASAVELKIRQTILDTIATVRELDDGDGATVRQIADRLNLDISSARRRLRSAEYAGFITNVEDKKGRGKPGRYRGADDRPDEQAELLPTPETLERGYALPEDDEPVADSAADRDSVEIPFPGWGVEIDYATAVPPVKSLMSLGNRKASDERLSPEKGALL